MTQGILLLGSDEVIESRAQHSGLAVEHGSKPALPFEKTLIVEAGTRVPFDLLPAGWHFLERWDAAVPFWRYGQTAAGVGTPAEREATQTIIRDLRVLLHATELLFVRRNEAGEALMATWLAERGDRRLAFLRAVYRVKPRLCVLPATWLLSARPAAFTPARAIRKNTARPLVRLELEPGRFVKVHAGDEEKVREQFRLQKAGGHR